MMHPCNCTVLRLLVVLCVGIWKTSMGSSSSCEVSRSTVQIVGRCPDNEKEWDMAAAKKNCSAYRNKCSQPDKLVYHCIINEHVTQTLEVCAYKQYILLGKCAGYSIDGNVVQQNSRTNCAIFTENPCPNVYNSDAAYKYPGCYELTQKSTTTELQTSMKNHDSTFYFTTSRSNVSFNTPENMLGEEEITGINSATLAIIIAPLCVVVLIIVIAVYFVRKRRRMKPRNENIQKDELSHLNGNAVTVEKEDML